MKRILNTLGKLIWGKRASAIFALCGMTVISLPAQTFTRLFSFNGADGGLPEAALVQATNGYLYGTTEGGGANGQGTVFKITPRGLLTLYSFCSQTNCADGNQPYAGLIQATNGYLYGTTQQGGANSGGTIFRITPSGTLTTLYSFCSQTNCTDGAVPNAGLVQSANGDLYGTTLYGGANNCPVPIPGCGTVFKIAPSGTLTTLYDFSFCVTNYCVDGYAPNAGLVQATNGDLYGTTSQGGSNVGAGACGGVQACGTVFKITPSGMLSTLYSFLGADGTYPEAGLVQATDGYLYGTTSQGGANGEGTVFKITPSGTLTTLYNFCSQTACSDGKYVVAGLAQATDGDLYGTTNEGGANNGGTVFKITPSGALTTLYSFDRADGWGPVGGLIQATNGDLYGTTSGGSGYGDGAIFSLS